MDFDKFQPVDDMNEVSHVFKKIFDDKKSYGTDTIRMGFFKGSVLTAKVRDNQIIFALPFNGPLSMLRDILEHTHYNKTNSVFVQCDVNDDNTMLTATFYTKEFKLFMDF